METGTRVENECVSGHLNGGRPAGGQKEGWSHGLREAEKRPGAGQGERLPR